MREIKFRAWDKKTSNVYEVASIDMFGAVVTMVKPSTTIEVDFIDRVLSDVDLMQYTGLKDKNGVEIYEGDIVDTFHKKYPKQYPDNFYPNGTPARQVKWIVGPHHNGWNIFAGRSSQYEVIGNIYENPELLEVK